MRGPSADPIDAAAPATAHRPAVLVVDDDAGIRRLVEKVLSPHTSRVDCSFSGHQALALVAARRYDAILSDISMPGMSGLDFLRAVRERDPDVPVVLMTGSPDLSTAIAAIEHGAFRYLLKPVSPTELVAVVERASRLHALALLRRRALDTATAEVKRPGGPTPQAEAFERALSNLYLLYQPIVSLREKRIVGREGLLRTREPRLSSPLGFLAAAESLGRIQDVGRAVRRRVAQDAAGTYHGAAWFVNVHPDDLGDPDLFDPATPLSQMARQVVLEITERASLEGVSDLGGRFAKLRGLGFRLAIDDLGAGYSGLASLTRMEPEMVKLDMSFVRDVVDRPSKRAVIRSTVLMCRELGTGLICEGVETEAERDALVDMGCEMFQGYLFGPPQSLEGVHSTEGTRIAGPGESQVTQAH